MSVYYKLIDQNHCLDAGNPDLEGKHSEQRFFWVKLRFTYCTDPQNIPLMKTNSWKENPQKTNKQKKNNKKKHERTKLIHQRLLKLPVIVPTR